MRNFAILVTALLWSTAALSEPPTHRARFEVSEAFLKTWAHEPVGDLQLTLLHAGPIHGPPTDCEIHVSAQIADPSISDFQEVVVEPPSVCVDDREDWRPLLEGLSGQECTARGFLRAWPEHLTGSTQPSNPNHFLEVHPLQKLSCGAAASLDFSENLKVVPDLGYKAIPIVRQMLSLRLWVCRGCSPQGGPPGTGEVPTIGFDYCFGDECTRGSASNFARFKVRVITTTIRPKTGAATPKSFATAIARVAPVSTTGNVSTQRMSLLKLYALEDSAFYDRLLALRGQTSAPTLDLIGIFAIDPFSVLKVLEAEGFSDGTWTPVPFPVSLVVFGEVE